MTPRPLREARIDLDAISSNVQTLRQIVNTDNFLAVVKAAGYGHGAAQAARAALTGGANWLGVVDLTEAAALRSAGITAPILTWLHAPGEDFRLAVDADICVGVSYLQQLEAAASAGVKHIQIKVDSGLGRNGVGPFDSQALFVRAAQLERSGKIQVTGLFSHLSNTGPDEDAAQLVAFESAVESARSAGLTPEFLHLAATAGALRRPEARFNFVRVGVGIYGLSPFDDATSADLGLTPALELSAQVVLVKRVPAGSGVSYGYRYHTNAETTLALVPLGYADGIPRLASNRGQVSIGGTTFRVAGTIAMDQVVIDVGDAPVAIGDRAIFFGDPASGVPSASDWARDADTINYELVTRLGGRVTRSYVGDPR